MNITYTESGKDQVFQLFQKSGEFEIDAEDYFVVEHAHDRGS